MSDLISKGAIYKKIAEMEDLARKRVLDMPTNSPCYMIYVAQLNERTALKHVIADAPTIEAEPVTAEWKIRIEGKPESGGTLGKFTCSRCGKHAWATATSGELNYCPNCGAKMKGAKT